ncbi:uncharacterized protein M6B38_117055 [Iris pallida]|uniref:Nucleotide-diphospho-sugar transferase domain-containing protein n=1 Tax=Iris pallida TaxID=29817 RepID=A0AAX6HRU8_IRIPA|nr:uncharacterized protein M6B38_117055 [Iris pallida]
MGLSTLPIHKITMQQPSSPPPSAAEASSVWIRRPAIVVLIVAAVVLPCSVIYLAGPAAPDVLSSSSARWKRTLPFLLVPDSAAAANGTNTTAAAAAAADGVVSDHPEEDNEQARLRKVLEGAATEDKTVILTTLNSAWASKDSVIDIFMESFRIGNGTRGLLEHLVVIAMDREAYERCASFHPHCYALVTEGVDFSGQKNFMSAGYLKMMWRRTNFLREVLEMGYNFVFTDTDIMWFRNPFPHFYPDGDFQIACDHFVGNELDLNNSPNGGFIYVKSNNRTIQFYKFWCASKERYPGRHEQDVLNFIKRDPFVREIGLQMRFLNTAYFGGLCEPSRDFNKVCTMHVNCCIGLSRKIYDLKLMLDDWRNYMAMPPERKISEGHTWSVPKNCSFAPLQH